MPNPEAANHQIDLTRGKTTFQDLIRIAVATGLSPSDLRYLFTVIHLSENDYLNNHLEGNQRLLGLFQRLFQP